jgi:colicin import membrane protein
MAGFVREHAGPLVLSALLHAAVIGLLAVGFANLGSRPTPQPQIALEATVVSEAAVAEEMRQLEEDERRRERAAREEEERAEQARRERAAEEKRLEDLRQQRALEEKAQLERSEQRKKEEVERARAAELAAKRKQEQEAKAAADKKRKAEDARLKREREAELKRRMAEEEKRAAAVDAGLLAQYVAQIQARVQRAWIRPPTARAGLNCVVYVTQVPGGEVVGVRVGECNGDDYVRQSIEAAVYRASPLPEPADPSLFERNLRLEFKPDE